MKKIILKYIRHKPLLRKFLSKIYLSYIKMKNIGEKQGYKKIYYINPQEITHSTKEYFDIFTKE
jgi:hypothetical protein